jgi:hypothetical protein
VIGWLNLVDPFVISFFIIELLAAEVKIMVIGDLATNFTLIPQKSHFVSLIFDTSLDSKYRCLGHCR